MSLFVQHQEFTKPTEPMEHSKGLLEGWDTGLRRTWNSGMIQDVLFSFNIDFP